MTNTIIFTTTIYLFCQIDSDVINFIHDDLNKSLCSFSTFVQKSPHLLMEKFSMLFPCFALSCTNTYCEVKMETFIQNILGVGLFYTTSNYITLLFSVKNYLSFLSEKMFRKRYLVFLTFLFWP